MIDLRSDTVTRPSAGMLECMMKASVGDMVFGEDPQVNELERMSAEMCGMDGALFCPSGTMTTQIAIKAHTRPGRQMIARMVRTVFVLRMAAGAAVGTAALTCSQGLAQDKGAVEKAEVLE